MNNFTIITPTGDRPEAFELCKRYVGRQTIQPSQWIIVDDGKEPISLEDVDIDTDINYIRRKRRFGEPKHTLTVQMQEALKYVNHKRILIIEDDDWYCRDYLERMLRMFDEHPQSVLVGQGQTIYYHIPLQRYFVHDNREHASWCQTGFRSDFMPEVIKGCRRCAMKNNPYVDLHLWRKTSQKYLLLNAPPLCIGIKALPGRVGACGGHRNTEGFARDTNFAYLRKWIGDDVELYRKFTKVGVSV